MKKHYLINSIFTLSICISFVLTANSQIRLIEVDPTNEDVTIHNFGGGTVDISSYWLCSRFGYGQLTDMTIVGGSLSLGSGAEVTVDAVAGTLSNLNNTSADLGLYTSNSFGSSSAMIDFVQWGEGGIGRESVATSKVPPIWSTGEFISPSAPIPYVYTGDGSSTDSGIGLEHWDPTLSTKDFSVNSFSISPNPASSFLTLKLPNSLDEVKVKIFDVLGKEIYNYRFLDAPINISNWSKGVYLVKVSSADGVHTKRFIKQ